MQTAIKGRNTSVSAELQDRIERRFAAVSRQVSPLAQLEIEVSEERNPSIAERYVVEATLHLKGVTLRACDRAADQVQALNRCSEELTRQVKRHRDRRRKRRESRAASLRANASPAA